MYQLMIRISRSIFKTMICILPIFYFLIMGFLFYKYVCIFDQYVVFPHCRATAASERNWYRVIETMYNGSSKSLSLADLERLEAAGLSFTHLFQQASHRKEDLIVRCLLLYMYMYLVCSQKQKIYHAFIISFYFLICPSVCLCLSRYLNCNYVACNISEVD